MYFYFKDEFGGVGVTSNKETFIGDVIWITKEEYEAILSQPLQDEEVVDEWQ